MFCLKMNAISLDACAFIYSSGICTNH
jgi:hypothetical protein